MLSGFRHRGQQAALRREALRSEREARKERLLADPRAQRIWDVLAENQVTFSSRSPIYRHQMQNFYLNLVEQLLAAQTPDPTA
jgi:hypothetical protein